MDVVVHAHDLDVHREAFAGLRQHLQVQHGADEAQIGALGLRHADVVAGGDGARDFVGVLADGAVLRGAALALVRNCCACPVLLNVMMPPAALKASGRMEAVLTSCKRKGLGMRARGTDHVAFHLPLLGGIGPAVHHAVLENIGKRRLPLGGRHGELQPQSSRREGSAAIADKLLAVLVAWRVPY